MALPQQVVRGGIVLAGALLVAMSLALSPARAAGACADVDLEPDGRNGARIADAVLCLLNQERAARGLRPVEGERKLRKAAKRHADDMVRRRYFEHTSPNGDGVGDRAKAARYIPKDRSWRVVENLAWGSGAHGSARHVVTSWMNSAPHRRNLLESSLRHAGVGVADATPSGRRGATITLVLGRR